MTTLHDALAALAHTRAELLTAISGLGEAVLDRKGVIGDWSVKNVLAHIAAWEAWVVQALPARMTTGATPEDFRQRAEDEDRF
ncbi:MAG: maleylpyruvate isomerase N-terminal domain-containing protein, partial [Roseiflexaceae bacterium]